MYLGFTVLELSKWKIYDFHYRYMLPKFNRNLSLCYMDTDSFIYVTKTDDFYSDISSELEREFDTSKYGGSENIFNMPLVNKKVLGMMKDENNGKITREFIGLRSKMYSIQVEVGYAQNKVKVVPKHISCKLKKEHFQSVLYGQEKIIMLICVRL